jgi:hypothetical protein
MLTPQAILSRERAESGSVATNVLRNFTSEQFGQFVAQQLESMSNAVSIRKTEPFDVPLNPLSAERVADFAAHGNNQEYFCAADA